MSPIRQSSVFLVVLLLGLSTAAGALAVFAVSAPAPTADAPPGRAGAVDGVVLLRTAAVTPTTELRIELPRVPPALPQGSPADAGGARRGPRFPEPRVLGSDPPPIFLTCCSFLC